MHKGAFLAMHLVEHETSVCFDKQSQPTAPCSFRWNLADAAAAADFLWEKNTVLSLKSIAEVVPKNMTRLFLIIS
jgi:hypothetical protein